MIGMFSAAQNRERLNAIEHALSLAPSDLTPDQRESLIEARDELRAWLADLWRIEGGGAS